MKKLINLQEKISLRLESHSRITFVAKSGRSQVANILANANSCFFFVAEGLRFSSYRKCCELVILTCITTTPNQSAKKKEESSDL